MSDPAYQAELMARRYRDLAQRIVERHAESETTEPIVLTSDDHMVTVTVSPAGQLLDLQFQQAALNRGDARHLAATTLATINRATAQVAEKQLGALREVFGNDDDAAAARAGRLDADAVVDRMSNRLRGGG